MTKQHAQPMHDRETQTQTAASFPGGVVELVVLVEDRLKLVIGNADSGVPDFDAQLSSVPAAAQQNLAVPGVFHCI